ncbi:MAG: TonB-dependent receptor [Paludibacteraceae bacterium]|nr:TonB-dependent receptor [Paludibacteraceae bacterium]
MKKSIFLAAYVAACGVAFANTDTLTFVRELDEVVVNAPVAQVTNNHTALTREQLNQSNTGQNLPFLLSSTPALVATSDDGLGIGYTYFRIRGTDHTRINMTLNDVPLNDSESQTVFWVNMTDMASSMTSLNVQRGVGTSTNGSASFGASINMSTSAKPTQPAEGAQPAQSAHDRSSATISFNGGMYNTFREMIDAHIVLPNQWRANARFSKVNSDGFLYRTASDLYSYYGDLGWYGTKTEVVGRFFGGGEKTGMGWDGVDYNTAYGINGADRRYNPAGEYTTTTADGSDSTAYYPNQTDNYAQQHAQLAITHRFTAQWSLSATAHYTHGAGYYEQYKRKKLSYWGLPYSHKAYGMYRKQLDNHFFGGVLSAKYISEPVDLQFGGAANYYLGDHFGTLHYLEDSLIIPINYEYYHNTARKTDANIYAKANWRIINHAQEKLSLYADLQYRYVRYERNGLNDEDMTDLPLSVDFHFFNPKAGLTYQNHGHLLAASFAIANREPSRNNYKENVIYDASTGEYTGLPHAERLYDYELGYTYSHPRFAIGANLYFMDYDNQLVLTGEYNDVGAYKTKNVKDSYRMGAEITAGVKITNWLRWDANLVASRNKILNYHQYIDLYDDQDNWNWLGQDSVVGTTTIAFSPTLTASSLFTFDIAGFTATVQTNFVSKQYLDNTQDENAMLRAYSTTNLNLQYLLPIANNQWPTIRLLCQINNIFNAKYANNGGAEASRFMDGSRCCWYYAQAGINIHAGFSITF